MRDRLSHSEKIFHGRLLNLNNTHFDDAAFGKLPEKVRENVTDTDSDRLAHAHPNMTEFVFCKVMEDVDGVDLMPGMEMSELAPLNLSRGDIHVLPYAAIQQYLLDDRVQLL